MFSRYEISRGISVSRLPFQWSTGRLITQEQRQLPLPVSRVVSVPQRECPPGPWTATTRSQRTGACECNVGWDLGKRTATCFDRPARTLAGYRRHVLHKHKCFSFSLKNISHIHRPLNCFRFSENHNGVNQNQLKHLFCCFMVAV
jgi:hypothetical protein